MKILLVEDDKSTVAALTEVLTAQRYVVESIGDGNKALTLIQTYDYDLVLLDVMIPGLDGVSLCRRLRSQNYQGLILMLTAKDAGRDRVTGLDAGADDYMVKPLDLAELLARLRALARRRGTAQSPILQWEDLQLDPGSAQVTYRGQPLHLTPKEYGLLELLLVNPARVYSRSSMIDLLWSSGEFPGEETVTAHIKGLRQKLKAIGCPDLIDTVYGLGYRLKSPPKGTRPDPPSSPTEPVPAPQAKVLQSLQRIWEKTQPDLEAQIKVLQVASSAYTTAELTPELQQQAQREAHKLAGSLGMFGFTQGSELARQMELLLVDPLTPASAEQLSALLTLLQQEVAQPPLPSQALSESPSALPQLLIVDDDLTLAERLRVAAIAAGMAVRVAPDVATARREIACHPPNVILLDLSFSEADEPGLRLMEELRDRQSGVAIVVFTVQNTLACRVQLAKLGSHLFLQKPALPEQVIATVRQALDQQAAKQPKLLVVDDDRTILMLLETELKRYGFQVKTLSDPKQFWTALVEVAPDLMILDIEMPDFNGLELCQVVRHDSQWGQLPIIVLTAHTEPELLQQIYAAGADDCIHKSIEESELIARLRHRLNRKQGDGLTIPPT